MTTKPNIRWENVPVSFNDLDSWHTASFGWVGEYPLSRITVGRYGQDSPIKFGISGLTSGQASSLEEAQNREERALDRLFEQFNATLMHETVVNVEGWQLAEQNRTIRSEIGKILKHHGIADNVIQSDLACFATHVSKSSSRVRKLQTKVTT